MFEIEVDAQFHATHRLRLAGGGYEPRHEHDWPVTVAVRSGSTAGAMVMDFHELAGLVESAIGPLRGTDLGEHAQLGPANPSAEHVASYIAAKVAAGLPGGVKLVRVTVGEADGCRASWLADD